MSLRWRETINTITHCLTLTPSEIYSQGRTITAQYIVLFLCMRDCDWHARSRPPPALWPVCSYSGNNFNKRPGPVSAPWRPQLITDKIGPLVGAQTFPLCTDDWQDRYLHEVPTVHWWLTWWARWGPSPPSRGIGRAPRCPPAPQPSRRPSSQRWSCWWGTLELEV